MRRLRDLNTPMAIIPDGMFKMGQKTNSVKALKGLEEPLSADKDDMNFDHQAYS